MATLGLVPLLRELGWDLWIGYCRYGRHWFWCRTPRFIDQPPIPQNRWQPESSAPGKLAPPILSSLSSGTSVKNNRQSVWETQSGRWLRNTQFASQMDSDGDNLGDSLSTITPLMLVAPTTPDRLLVVGKRPSLIIFISTMEQLIARVLMALISFLSNVLLPKVQIAPMIWSRCYCLDQHLRRDASIKNGNQVCDNSGNCGGSSLWVKPWSYLPKQLHSWSLLVGGTSGYFC